MSNTSSTKFLIPAETINRAVLAVTSEVVTAETPTNTEKALWAMVKDSIMPHLYAITPDVIEDAYGSESEGQREYRDRIYRSMSNELLLQSILDIRKIAQSDDFVVSYNETVAQILERTYMDKTPIGKNIIKKFTGALYQNRVLDPNGYFGIVPQNYQNSSVGEKRYVITTYPSENIVARSSTVIAFAVGPNLYRVYTTKAVFDINGAGEVVGVPFKHSSGDLGCYQLGGVPTDIQVTRLLGNNIGLDNVNLSGPTAVVTIQKSDYSYAVNRLDRLENRNSQNEVITGLHVSPKMVSRDLGCDECEGTGKVAVKDVNGNELMKRITRKDTDGNDMYYEVVDTHTCHKCSGKGVISIGTQDVITVPPETKTLGGAGGENNLTDLAKNVIAYVTPEITSAEFLYKQLNDCEQGAKEILRLQRFEDFSESGAAKRIDQEAGQPRLRAIAEGIQDGIRDLLRGLCRFEYIDGIRQPLRDTAIESITVGLPSFFDLTTVAESKALYFQNIADKPISERYLEYRNIVKKQYQSPLESAIFEAAYYITNGSNLLLQSELVELKAVDAITVEEVYVAKFADSIIRRTLFNAAAKAQPIDIVGMSREDFAAIVQKEIDIDLAKMRAARAATTAASVI